MKPIALPSTTVALLFSGFLTFPAAGADAPSVADYRDFDAPPHQYRTRTPRDRFSRLLESLPADPRLDRSSEKAFLVSFLKILDVPPASQMLVFSTTSLQLRFISPANPRAIYFNEDVYVGYIPGGRLEVVSLDPELGPIFYIFDIPKNDATATLRFERSERCMNCHAGEDTGFVPGLVVKSVIPGPGGGSLDAFRSGQSGHGIPLSDRFGGWHVTGLDHFTNHWGNLTGRMTGGEIETISNQPGRRFQFAKYPVGTSDILAHLLHEHQVGFVNRVVQAGYRARTALFHAKGQLTPTQAEELDEQARIVTRYLLFADETPLPTGGIKPDPQFHADFQRQRRLTPDGRSLKDLELATRLFQHRCSYMIYSPVFEALPPVMKNRVYERLRRALHTEGGDREFAYLPSLEKTAIRQILQATLKDLPSGW